MCYNKAMDTKEKTIQEESRKRAEACMKEVQAVLDTYGFMLKIETPQIIIVDKSRKEE